MSDTATTVYSEPVRSEMGSNWPIVLGVFTCLMLSVGTIVLYTYGVFAPELAKAFGWSRAEVAGGILAHNLGIIIGAPLSGYLADRFGSRRIILASVVIFAVLWATLYFLQPPIWNFYVVLAALPVIAGGAMPIAYSKIVVNWFDRQRGFALGLSLAGVGVGATVLPPLAQYIIGTYGWREAYLAFAGLALIVPLPVAYLLLFEPRDRSDTAKGLPARLVRPAPNAPVGGGQVSVVRGPAGDVVGAPAFWVMIIFFLVTGVALTAAIVNLVPILTEKDISRETAALIASVLGLAVIAGRVVIGMLLDKFSPRLVISVVCIGPAIAFAILTFGGGIELAIVAAALMGFAVGAEVDIMAYLVSRFFPAGLFGRLYGLMFATFVIGGAGGPLLVGYLRDANGDYMQALMILSGLMVFAACVILALPPIRRGAAT